MSLFSHTLRTKKGYTPTPFVVGLSKLLKRVSMRTGARQAVDSINDNHTKYVAPRKVWGYTLAEAVVYIAIFSIFSVIAINSILIMTASFKTVRAERAVNTAALSGFDRIVRASRLAASVNTLGSVFDTNPGTLALVDSDGGTETFYIENGRLVESVDGTLLGALTPETVVIDSLIFRLISVGTTLAVRVEMTVHDSRNPDASREFTNTALLRGTY